MPHLESEQLNQDPQIPRLNAEGLRERISAAEILAERRLTALADQIEAENLESEFGSSLDTAISRVNFVNQTIFPLIKPYFKLCPDLSNRWGEKNHYFELSATGLTYNRLDVFRRLKTKPATPELLTKLYRAGEWDYHPRGPGRNFADYDAIDSFGKKSEFNLVLDVKPIRRRTQFPLISFSS